MSTREFKPNNIAKKILPKKQEGVYYYQMMSTLEQRKLQRTDLNLHNDKSSIYQEDTAIIHSFPNKQAAEYVNQK